MKLENNSNNKQTYSGRPANQGPLHKWADHNKNVYSKNVYSKNVIVIVVEREIRVINRNKP